MTPNWIDAPEGYDFWVVDKEGKQPSGWHRKAGNSYVDQDGFFWRDSCNEMEVYRRPVWDGNGLPPIGSKCLFDPREPDDVEWHPKLLEDGSEVVEILAHYSPCGDSIVVAVFVFDSKDGGREVEQATAACFRPLPPPVDEELAEIERLYREGGPAAVWDAGYRRTV